MALTEAVIFSDPVLQRIFFDERRVAPRSKYSAGAVANHWYAISECKVVLLKVKRVETAEAMQREMRTHWFLLRKLCDGYFADMLGHDDACEHVVMFRHDNDADVFNIDQRARTAYWYKYEQQAPPKWAPVRAQSWRRYRRR